MTNVWPDCMIASGSEGPAAFSCRGYGALLAERDALAARLAEAERDAARYEKVRRLNVPQFKALFDRNICTGESFDSLVDQIIADSATPRETASHE